MSTARTNVARSRARALRTLRQSYMAQIYTVAGGTTGIAGGRGLDQGPDPFLYQAVSDVAGSVNRLAGTLPTVYDGGGAQPGVSGSLERQVERAMAQVLGRASGRDGNGFALAVRETFPLTVYGADPAATPVRSALNLGNSSDRATRGGSGQLAPQQASLYRQTALVVTDAWQLLASMTSFVPTADDEQVSALRVRVQADLQALMDEFGRLNEPRDARVSGLFTALDMHLVEFGEAAGFDQCASIVTPTDESQSAGFRLLQTYAAALRRAWEAYTRVDSCPPLGRHLARAQRLLPIITQARRDLEQALDSVGFTDAERQSEAARFISLSSFQLPDHPMQELPHGERGGLMDSRSFALASGNAIEFDLQERGVFTPSLATMTVSDLIDWLDRYVEEASVALSDSGSYGLQYAADQADRLFWVIAPVVAYLRTTLPLNLITRSTLGQVLSHERVRWSLDGLLGQLNAMADLAVS